MKVLIVLAGALISLLGTGVALDPTDVLFFDGFETSEDERFDRMYVNIFLQSQQLYSTLENIPGLAGIKSEIEQKINEQLMELTFYKEAHKIELPLLELEYWDKIKDANFKNNDIKGK